MQASPLRHAPQRIDLASQLEQHVVRAHSDAPLQMYGTFHFDASQALVFERVTDPALIAEWFAMVRGGSVDHSTSENPGTWGAGSRRLCNTTGMGKLDETILHWNAPESVAYNVKNIMMPVRDHVALMVVEPEGPGARLSWHQYFRYTGLVIRHAFPTMMLSMMNSGMAKLANELGGEGGRMVRT